MLIKILTLSFFIWLCGTTAIAQITHKDSVIKAAYKDAKSFKLNKEQRSALKSQKITSSSDVFKPVKSNVSDTTLLLDSDYVNAYRVAAYTKAIRSKSTGHKIFVGAGLTIGILLVAVTTALLVIIGKWN